MELDKSTIERTVTMNLSKKSLLRGALFMTALHLCVWIPYSILACFDIDIAVIAVPLIVGLISIPLYFAVKGNASWQYSLSALAAHFLLSGIAFLLIGILSDMVATTYDSWESVGHFFVLMFILAIGFILLVLDGVICLVQRSMKGREA